MKKINTMVLLVLFLSACTPLQIATPTETLAPTFIPTSTPTLTPPPFSKEVLDSFGEIYYYEEGLGLVYKNADGTERLVMKLNDARTAWVDDESYTEFSLDAYKPILVNGVEPDGRPVKIIHTRVVGEDTAKHTEIYLPKTGGWRSTVGYEPGKTSEIDIMKWSLITKEDVESGFIRASVLSNQYSWPENAITPEYSYSFMGGRDGAFKLGIYGVNEIGVHPTVSDGGILAIAQPLMYRMGNPVSNEQVAIAAELRRGPEGSDIVLVSAISNYYTVSNKLDGEFGENGGSNGIEYLVGLDDRDCSTVDLGKGSASGSRVVNDICGFMPKDDPRWDFATWETIANGGEPGSVEESSPLTLGDLSKWQDSVMLALNKFN